jgi:hypothetical protein
MNAERTSLFLIANLGAEVARLLSFREKNEVDAARESFKRAEGILARLQVLPEMQTRLEELTLLSAVIADFHADERTLSVSPEDLQEYFYPFALRLTAP